MASYLSGHPMVNKVITNSDDGLNAILQTTQSLNPSVRAIVLF